jgi:hypothetical protein
MSDLPDWLVEATVAAAPPLDDTTVERLRDLLASAERHPEAKRLDQPAPAHRQEAA